LAGEAVALPGWFGRIGAGVAGGLAGGALFGVLMQATGAIPVVASLVDQESIAVGWAVHLGISVAVGATFAIIFGFFAEGVSISMVLGAFYGIIWWVLGGLTLMPMRLGLGLFVFDDTAWQSLAGHLAYGLALGLIYALACHLLAGREPATVAGPEGAAPAGLAAGQVTDGWPSPSLFAPPAEPEPFFPPATSVPLFPPATSVPLFPPAASGPTFPPVASDPGYPRAAPHPACPAGASSRCLRRLAPCASAAATSSDLLPSAPPAASSDRPPPALTARRWR
jgi:hypothetical protein